MNLLNRSEYDAREQPHNLAFELVKECQINDGWSLQLKRYASIRGADHPSSRKRKRSMRVSVTTAWSYRGLRTVVLENRLLRLVVLPEAGAKIWQITYKPYDADLLWNNPRIAPARLPGNSRYDDVWSGGWDELFPNDEIALIEGESYPDHGELWTGEWERRAFSMRRRSGRPAALCHSDQFDRSGENDSPATRSGSHRISSSLHQSRKNRIPFSLEASSGDGRFAATSH